MTFEEFDASVKTDVRALYTAYDEELFVEDPPPGGHCKLDKDLFICRFCVRSKSDGATFKSRAHVVPEALGNRSMVSHSECDDCNALFGKHDAHLARFMGANSVVAGVEGKARGKGKGRIRTHVNPVTGLSLSRDAPDDHIRMAFTIALDEFGHDPEQRTMIAQVNTQPYSPLRAWKAVMKIGLSVCDFNDMSQFTWLRDTICTHEGDESLQHSSMCWVRRVELPGPLVPIGPVSVTLYKARDLDRDDLMVPSKLIRILSGRTMIQSYLLSDQNIERLSRHPSPAGCFFPAPVLISKDDFVRFGPPRQFVHDMSGIEERIDKRDLPIRYTTPPISIDPDETG